MTTFTAKILRKRNLRIAMMIQRKEILEVNLHLNLKMGLLGITSRLIIWVKSATILGRSKLMRLKTDYKPLQNSSRCSLNQSALFNANVNIISWSLWIYKCQWWMALNPLKKFFKVWKTIQVYKAPNATSWLWPLTQTNWPKIGATASVWKMWSTNHWTPKLLSALFWCTI